VKPCVIPLADLLDKAGVGREGGGGEGGDGLVAVGPLHQLHQAVLPALKGESG